MKRVTVYIEPVALTPGAPKEAVAEHVASLIREAMPGFAVEVIPPADEPPTSEKFDSIAKLIELSLATRILDVRAEPRSAQPMAEYAAESAYILATMPYQIERVFAERNGEPPAQVEITVRVSGGFLAGADLDQFNAAVRERVFARIKGVRRLIVLRDDHNLPDGTSAVEMTHTVRVEDALEVDRIVAEARDELVARARK